jgi:hypothetical protein
MPAGCGCFSASVILEVHLIFECRDERKKAAIIT